VSTRNRPVPTGVVAGVAVAAAALVGLSVLLVATYGAGFDGRNRSFAAISCPAPSLPGSVVSVALADMGGRMRGPVMGGGPMMVSLRTDRGSVPSGQVSFVVRNRGNLVHEMLVLPLPADGPGTRRTGSDGKIDERDSRGEASRSCAAGAGDGLAPGSTGWVTLDLAPGRYELLCDEPWHYAAGMYDMLTVR